MPITPLPGRLHAYLGSILSLATVLAMPQAHADLVVLQYHHVSDDTPVATSTSRSLFQAQLDTIAALGLDIVPLDSGTQAALAGQLEDRQQIAITFDDAYSSVYFEAAPQLLERNLPFTIFVNTGNVGHHGYLSWAQLSELSRQPGVLVANHSEDHSHLIRRPGESFQDWSNRVTSSMDGAQATLKEKLGTELPMIAYPYGEFSGELERLVNDRGWFGYGQQSGAVGAHSASTRLPRFPMANAYGQLNGLKDKLLSRAFPIDGQYLPDTVIHTNPPVLELTLPPELTPAQLSCFATGQGRIDVSQGDNEGRVSVSAPKAFSGRRFRYNCTYPAGGGRFYWLSQGWLDPNRPED